MAKCVCARVNEYVFVNMKRIRHAHKEKIQITSELAQTLGERIWIATIALMFQRQQTENGRAATDRVRAQLLPRQTSIYHLHI